MQAESVNPISTFDVGGSKIIDSPAKEESTPTTTEPDPENVPFDDFTLMDQECHTYVHVEAYALARCAQRMLK